MPKPFFRRCRRLAAIVVGLALLAVGCSIETEDRAHITVADDQSVSATSETALDSADANPTNANDRATEGAGTPGSTTTEPPRNTGSTSAPDGVATDGSTTEDEGSTFVEATIGVGSDGAGDRYYPTYGNGGYDISSYDLDLVWDHDSRLLDGQATITMTATQALNQFNLDLIGFDIRSIEVDGMPAAYLRDGRELIIQPATTIDLDALATVVVSYTGKPTLLQSIGGPYATGWRDLADTIVAAGEPDGAAGWYPVNAHPIDKALYRISVTTDSGLTVAANGTLVSRTEDADLTTWVYASAHPQAAYLTTLAIGDFVTHQGAGSASGVPVRHFFHRTVFDRGVATMERTGLMIDAFEQVFGPYPFENYGTVVFDADLGFALETQTLSVFSSDLVNGSAVAKTSSRTSWPTSGSATT